MHADEGPGHCYLARLGYTDMRAMVTLSGEVVDAESADFPLTRRNMNPDLRGRNMRKAFDTGDYQVMIVANKFQTGFDQPKLCAMHVLKPLKGVDCVQTLSRLNRTYPGNEESGTFILDFVNDPQDVLESFLPYYKTAALSDVSDPNQMHSLFDKLASAGIYQWSEVEHFAKAYFDKKKSDQALSSICKPARDRWRDGYRRASKDLKLATDLVKRAKKSGDAVLVANAENEQRDAKGDELLVPGGEFGTGQGREKKLEPLSVFLGRMNDRSLRRQQPQRCRQGELRPNHRRQDPGKPRRDGANPQQHLGAGNAR